VFLSAVERSDSAAGPLYVSFLAELTEHINNVLLLEMIEIAELNKLGQKVIGVCASSSNKISGMLSAKIYKKRTVKELAPIAEMWKNLLKNTSGDVSGCDNSGRWYLLTPISDDFAQSLESIFLEKGDSTHFVPQSLDNVMGNYEKLAETIIDVFFLEGTRSLDIGSITRKMLTTGVSTVEKAIESVFEKVIRPLEPEHFARVVDHTNQFYLRA